MEYTSFLSIHDIIKRGYDLLADGFLEIGAFATIEDAANDFMQECFDSIYNMIEEHNGSGWTYEFFNDMSEDINEYEKPNAYKKQQALRYALINQTIFILENGDKNASAMINKEKVGFSPKAIQKLYNAGILEV